MGLGLAAPLSLWKNGTISVLSTEKSSIPNGMLPIALGLGVGLRETDESSTRHFGRYEVWYFVNLSA